ncbi:AT hook, DNA-binding motif-containing protein [Heracleum sosnowskyi]|uniref:AT hook, DNA-binding motif-containing protein n=1 Tax=Heracleum sosnowskyi TaxID=360622 RepID=A0AAD8M4S9_9APIA|nr:AT hook, DNA-binding motif-containing protein [Heracleum sosnowskyi]
MSEAIQGNNSYASAGLPIKRKRGRPRKDKSLYRVASVRPRTHENVHRVENAIVSPGASVFKGDHVNQVEDTSSGLVGQAVSGVVESVFDAGYLLAVKIGNSNITLRGVVFKPGQYAPITSANDVAPRVQAIKRNEILLPTQNQNIVRHVDNLGNGSLPHPLPNNSVSTNDRYTSSVAAPSVPPVQAGGTVVPVLENVATVQDAQIAALKGKYVQTITPPSTYDPNKSALDSSQSHTLSYVIPGDENNKDGPFDNSSLELQQGKEGKSMNSLNMPLPAEAEFQGGLQSSKAQDFCSVPEQETSDMNEPLFVEPLRTVHTTYHNQSPFIPNLVGHNGIGRMTELLQAVQENLKDNSRHPEHLPAFSNAEYDEQKIPGTGQHDEEVVESGKHFQAPSV